MKPFYFGNSRTPLFGSFYPARGISSRSVLLCPPVGHEYTRSHRALRNLANSLANNGYHALLFDYRGIGDSQGSLNQVNNIELWLDDIETAARELLDETMATQLSAVGLRLGANLLSQASDRLPSLKSLVLWEPYPSGQAFLNNHRRMQELILSVWMHDKKALNTELIEEILGFAYPKTLIQEIAKINLENSPDNLNRHIVTCCHKLARHLASSNPNILLTQDVCDWEEQRAMELAWLGASGLGKIVDLFVKTKA